MKEESTTNESNPATERWKLVRQDDHGNRYVIGTFDSRKEAQEAMAHYESKGHKQTYWIESTLRDGL